MSYHAYRRNAKIFYKTLMSTPSQHFGGAYVVFNNIGFRHLIRKAKVRSRKEQMKRFGLLSAVQEIISNPHASVSYRTDFKGDRIIQYWAFNGEKDGLKIKVVVRQVGNGVKHFYSVMDVH